jgi:hypothetical protein
MITKRVKIVALFMVMFLCGVGQAKVASAFIMGEIQVFSKKADLFHAEIPIELATGEQIKRVLVTIGDRTDYAIKSASQLKSTVVKEDTQSFLIITGNTPQETPFFTLLVQIDLANRTLHRNFSVHLDGIVTPLPARKSAAAVKVGVKNIEPASKASTSAGRDAIYWLWWLIGAILAGALFWVWRSQGPSSDEDMLTIAKEADSKHQADNWDPIFSADEEPEPEPEPDMVPATESLEKPSIASLRDPVTEHDDEEDELLEEIDLNSVTDNVALATEENRADSAATELDVDGIDDDWEPLAESAAPSSAPLPTPGGRLSSAVTQGAGVSPPVAQKQERSTDDDEMSIETVMHSLERILENEAGAKAKKSSS